MTLLPLEILTIALYLAATLVQTMGLSGVLTKFRYAQVGLSLSALIFHGFLLYHWIDEDTGQDLSLFNLLSLCFWLAACIVLVINTKRNKDTLFLLLLPFTALSIIAILALSDPNAGNIQPTSFQVFHILLSSVTTGVLAIAGLQAILLVIQNYFLRHRPNLSLKFMPPLSTMETFLFRLIGFGFILLNLVIISAIITCYSEHALQWSDLTSEKLLVSLLCWVIFLSLLIGHHYYGWRGNTVARWTLAGVILIFITYAASPQLL